MDMNKASDAKNKTLPIGRVFQTVDKVGVELISSAPLFFYISIY